MSSEFMQEDNNKMKEIKEKRIGKKCNYICMKKYYQEKKFNFENFYKHIKRKTKELQSKVENMMPYKIFVSH